MWNIAKGDVVAPVIHEMAIQKSARVLCCSIHEMAFQKTGESLSKCMQNHTPKIGETFANPDICKTTFPNIDEDFVNLPPRARPMGTVLASEETHGSKPGVGAWAEGLLNA